MKTKDGKPLGRRELRISFDRAMDALYRLNHFAGKHFVGYSAEEEAPDLKKARRVLKHVGIDLDEVMLHAKRLVLSKVFVMVEQGLQDAPTENYVPRSRTDVREILDAFQDGLQDGNLQVAFVNPHSEGMDEAVAYETGYRCGIPGVPGGIDVTAEDHGRLQ